MRKKYTTRCFSHQKKLAANSPPRPEVMLLYKLRKLEHWTTAWVALLSSILNSSECLAFTDKKGERKGRALMRKFLNLDLWDSICAWCGLQPAESTCCGCHEQARTDYKRPVEKKGGMATPAWTGFYCFSGHITSRMILIYYAQLHCRWLPFTDNKGHNAANYFKEKHVTAQGGKQLNWFHSILGWFSTDFRKLKILSTHLLPQSRVREFSESKSHSSLGTMQAWFPMGESVHGLGSCVPTCSPPVFWIRGWSTFSMPPW